MKPILACLLAVYCSSSLADTVLTSATKPGDINYISVVVAPGAGEAHPLIVLKDGSSCDLLSLVCLSKAERDFGEEAYIKLRQAVQRIVGSH